MGETVTSGQGETRPPILSHKSRRFILVGFIFVLVVAGIVKLPSLGRTYDDVNDKLIEYDNADFRSVVNDASEKRHVDVNLSIKKRNVGEQVGQIL